MLENIHNTHRLELYCLVEAEIENAIAEDIAANNDLNSLYELSYLLQDALDKVDKTIADLSKD